MDYDLRHEFEKAMAGRGIIPPPGGVIADGRLHRCDSEGKNGRWDSAYVLYPDYPPAGGFENWRDGYGWQKWRPEGVGGNPSGPEGREQRAQWEAARKARDAERAAAQEKASETARRVWEGAAAVDPSHPYLKRKSIRAHDFRVDRAGWLVVPMRDSSGSLLNVQRIAPDGGKRFLPGGRIAGLYYAAGPAVDPDGTIVIAEGVATALSILEATGLPVVAAMSATNLPAVSAEIRKRFPKVRFVIFADNDAPGLKHGTEAARVSGALIAIPPKEGDDANDLYAREGAEAVLGVVNGARQVEGPDVASTGKDEELLVSSDVRRGSEPAPWPAPPADPAYHGLTGEFVRLIEPHTEADPTAILLQFLAMSGNVIGRSIHAVVEADRHYTNLFVGVVGHTSKARKGVSQGQSRRSYETVDPVWSKDHVQGGLSSGEGLIWAVRDPVEHQEPVKEKGRVVGYQMVVSDPGITDKRLFVYEPELATTLRVMGRDGSTLSPVIRQAWDCGNLRTMVKNNPAKATDVHISILGHITKGELLRYLDATEKGNGFANRFLWACARRSKMLPRGGALHRVDFAPFLRRLSAAVDHARRHGERAVTFDEEAGAYWDGIYGPLSEGGTGMAAEVTSRAEAQVLRLSLIYAALDQADAIRLPHLQAAEAVWRYCEASVRFIFGDTQGDPIADEILAELRRVSPRGLTRTDLREHFQRHRRSDQIGRALATLEERGLARMEQERTGGRTAERWYATSGCAVSAVSGESAEAYRAYGAYGAGDWEEI